MANKVLTSIPMIKGVENMQRRLVLTNENAGHYMRRNIAAEALLVNPKEVEEKPVKWWRSDDTHLFMISFGAFFTVFYTFIA
jgi:hypothetical protein